MARVLNSISLTAPAAPVEAAVDDSFTFTGTPSFTGSGGVQRYDMKWEVDAGAGFITIEAGAGLTTADDNPLVNSNSASANSITVDCTEAGSYTIRVSGAPTSGGSYTVVSSTQTVEVSAGEPVTTPQAVPAVALGAPALARVVTYSRAISSAAVGVPAVSKANVFLKAVSATAQGVAVVSTALLTSVGIAATAVGSATLSAGLIIAQAVAATAIGVVSLATEFIAGAGGRAFKFARGCIAGIGRMMGR